MVSMESLVSTVVVVLVVALVDVSVLVLAVVVSMVEIVGLVLVFVAGSVGGGGVVHGLGVSSRGSVRARHSSGSYVSMLNSSIFSRLSSMLRKPKTLMDV